MTVLTTASLSLFSAYAEVFLRNSFDIAYSVAFLCLRRGVSPSTAVGVALDGFSLPTQRCFYIEAVRPDLDPKKVFTDFRFYWENGRGSSTRRSDKGWTQSWQTWVRREKEAQRREGGQRRGEEFRPGEEDTTGFRNLFR